MSNKKKPRNTQTTKVRPADQGHINALKAEQRYLEQMTPVGLRRIAASFPEIRNLLDKLGWLIEVTDPTAGRNMDPKVTTSNHNDGISQAAAAVSRFVHVQGEVREELRGLNRRLGDTIEGGEFERYRPEPPRCRKTDPNTGEKCSKYNLRQPYGTVICQGSCGRPIDE